MKFDERNKCKCSEKNEKIKNNIGEINEDMSGDAFLSSFRKQKVLV
jgi:hypothetical protein